MLISRFGTTVINSENVPSYNLLSSIGDCESTLGWTNNTATVTEDDSNAFAGAKCLKIVASAAASQRVSYNIYPLLDKTKYYMISAFLKNFNASGGNGIYVRLGTTGGANKASTYIKDTSYVRTGVLIQPSDIAAATAASIQLYISAGASGQYGFMDNLMLNEITENDFVAGLAACLAKYQYQGA